MQGGRVQGKEEENVRCKNECRDAGSHHAAFKQGGRIIHAIVTGVVPHFGMICFVAESYMRRLTPH